MDTPRRHDERNDGHEADHAPRSHRRTRRERLVAAAGGADDRGHSAIFGRRNGKGTNLFEPLAQAAERIKNLRGVVLASDGDWNEGEPRCKRPRRCG